MFETALVITNTLLQIVAIQNKKYFFFFFKVRTETWCERTPLPSFFKRVFFPYNFVHKKKNIIFNKKGNKKKHSLNCPPPPYY